MNKVIARPPPDALANDYEQQCERMSWCCSTCWGGVVQQYIMGLWKHTNEYPNCTNLVPIKESEINRDAQWRCQHDFDRVEGLNGVKCNKCGLPHFSHDFDGWGASTRNLYFCKECNIEFKLLKQHYEGKHKRKMFIYKELKKE